jgi:hypothetical protein
MENPRALLEPALSDHGGKGLDQLVIQHVLPLAFLMNTENN